ncbi:MAG: putative oxidoreductase [Verrucomicrobiales bacterium]|jgi:putative oxidoreductase
MKEKLPTIAGGLLGFAFVFFGINFFVGILKMPPPPAGSPPALFFGAVGSTGFMAMVKILEIIGGVLVAIPKTRNFGLLILGPIVINILAFNLFLVPGISALFQPPVVLISALSAYLLWVGREKFLALRN